MLENKEFTISMLSDPTCFAVNRLPAHAAFETEKDENNHMQTLSGAWWFQYAENPSTVNWDFVSSTFDCTAWNQIKVPAEIQREGYDKPHYVNRMYPWDGVEEVKYPNVPVRFNPVAQYVKYVTLETLAPRTFISFQGAETALALWVNGQFVGYSEDSYTPADFELTQYLSVGENKIAVAVFKFSTGSWLEDQDFWRMSGLMRDVFLYTSPETRVADFYFSPVVDLAAKTAEVHLTLTLENAKTVDRVSCELLDACGRCVASAQAPADRYTQLDFSVENVALWSAEQPNLYQLVLCYQSESGEIIQKITDTVGFKTSEIKDGLWYVNGKRLVINGVNRHDFSHINGRSVSKEEMLWDVVQMKRHNINAVRTCHYPNQTYFYQLCSKYGLYVMDETNLETHGTWKYGIDALDAALPGSKPEWKDIVVDRTCSMFERDKNLPCVISWSLGNESYGGQNFREMKKAIRKKDKTTPVHYEGVWHCRDFADVTDMTSAMYTKAAEIRELLAEKNEKPFILCEFSHAMGNSCGGLQKYVQLTEEVEQYQGGFIWDYIDQSLETRDEYGKKFLGCGGDFGDLPNDSNFCVNGIVFGNRTLSPKMQLVKNCFQPITFALKEGKAVITNKMLFTNLNEFDLRWSLSRNGEEIDTALLNLEVAPGEVKAVSLPVAKCSEAGEYTQTVEVLLAQDTAWEKKGYVLMHGQNTWGTFTAAPPIHKKLRVENSEINLGIYGDTFSCMFARKTGGLISYKVCGREIITTMPKPNFWRAPTDNDRGNQMDSRLAVWKTAGLYARAKGFEETILEDRVVVAFSYQLALLEPVECKVTYTVFGDGTLQVDQMLAANPQLPDLPEFSWMIGVASAMQNLQWYGFGPEDTYEDTLYNAKLGVFESNVRNSLQPYVIPQESGNKCGVRWMQITDEGGRGIAILGENPLQVSALPFNPHQLESFARPNRLPETYETVLRVSERKMGVGGDDSWGAPIHPEYLVSAAQEHRLCFAIRPIV